MSGHLDDVDRMDIDGEAGTPVRSIEGWIIVLLNLHEETSEEDIQDRFGEFGAIRNLHLNLDRRTGYVKGYAFLEYLTKEEADRAVAQTDGTPFLGQTIQVGFAFVAPPASSTKPAAGGGGGDEEQGDQDERTEQNSQTRHRSRSPERQREDS